MTGPYGGPERRAIPDHWLSEQITQMRQEIRDARIELRDLRTELVQKLETHADEDEAVEKRVTIIETERKSEQREAIARHTWVTLIAAGAFTFLWNLLKEWMARKP